MCFVQSQAPGYGGIGDRGRDENRYGPNQGSRLILEVWGLGLAAVGLRA